MAGKTRMRAQHQIEDTLEDKDGDTRVMVEESSDEDKIRFDTAGTQRMIIDETGQVGVGTDAPEEQFHIHGNNATLRLGNGTNSGEHSPKIQFSESADANGDMVYGYSVGYNGSTNNFEIKRYADSTTGNIVMTAGRAFGHVGLQTESPEADLHVFAGNSGQTFSNVSGIAVENAGSSDGFFVFQTATAGGGKSFSITNGGKVGIGTTTPDARLHLNTSTTDDVLLLETTEDSSSASPVFKMKRNSSSPADADYLGQIKFAGENDANQEVNYAKITGKIDDASDGSEDGILEFANIKAGSQTITARLRSDSLQLLNSTSLTVDGSIGVGTTSPTSILTLNGTQPTLTFRESDSDRAEILINDSDNLVITNQSSNKYIVFKTNDAGTIREGLRVGGVTPEVVVNEGSDSLVDFRVESNNNTHMLFVDGGNEKVGIGTSSPTEALDVDGTSIRLRQSLTPSSASDVGAAGQLAWDSNYIYVCVATDTWKRVAISTW